MVARRQSDQYEIEILDDKTGRCDLRRNRHPVRYDLDDLDEALRYARRAGATEVTVVEPDGYRHRVRP